MDLYGAVVDFINMIISYIDLLKKYLEEANISDLLNYLFYCIPEEIREIIIVILLLLLVLGIRNALKR